MKIKAYFFLFFIFISAVAFANNTVQTALPIEVNREYSDTLTSSSDVNYYEFELPKDGTVKIVLRHEILTDSTIVYWRAYLYMQSDLSQALNQVNLQGAPQLSSTQEGLGVGKYIIKINSSTFSPGQYFLTVFYTEGTNYEKSPNNTAQQANMTNLDTEYMATISSSSDVDWYKFQLTTPGNLRIDMRHSLLSHSTSTYWVINLYSEKNLSLVLRSINLKATPQSEYAEEGLPGGWYYIKIENSSISNALYYFKLSFVSGNFFEKSPNNNLADATPIMLNQYYTANLSSSVDEDYYKFFLAQSDQVSITLFHDTLLSSSSIYWRAYLYSETTLASALASLSLKGNEKACSITIALSSGVYYIKFDNSSYYDPQTYKMIVFSGHNTQEDFYEINNTLATAYDLSQKQRTWLSNISGKGVQLDDDWYKVLVLPLYKRLQVRLFFTHSEGDIDLYLYNDSGELVSSSRTQNDQENIDVLVAKEGTYYIKVCNANSGNFYDLWWDILPDTDQISPGKALIVAGGGITNNTLWETTEYLTNRFYEILKRRQFSDQDIMYITDYSYNYDLDGDGKDDIVVDDTEPANSDIESYFEIIANQVNKSIPLIIYLADHGGPGRFKMSRGEYLEGNQLDEWLDAFQTKTNCQVIVIVEACYSKTFIVPLTPTGTQERILISSTGEGLAYYDQTGVQSFSRYFFDRIVQGDNIKKSFDITTNRLSDLYLFANQSPTLIDQLQGKASELFTIGGSHLYGDAFPEILDSTESQTISSIKFELFVKATDAEKIESVWASILPPYFNPNSETFMYTSTTLELKQTETSLYKNQYDFTCNGVYVLTFFVQDSGHNIDTKEIRLSTEGGMNCNQVIDSIVEQAIINERLKWDIDNDNKVGIREAIRALQEIVKNSE